MERSFFIIKCVNLPAPLVWQKIHLVIGNQNDFMANKCIQNDFYGVLDND